MRRRKKRLNALSRRTLNWPTLPAGIGLSVAKRSVDKLGGALKSVQLELVQSLKFYSLNLLKIFLYKFSTV